MEEHLRKEGEVEVEPKKVEEEVGEKRDQLREGEEEEEVLLEKLLEQEVLEQLDLVRREQQFQTSLPPHSLSVSEG